MNGKVNQKVNQNSSLSRSGRRTKAEMEELRKEIIKSYKEQKKVTLIASEVKIHKTRVYSILRKYRAKNPEIDYERKKGQTNELKRGLVNVHGQRLRLKVHSWKLKYESNFNTFFKDFEENVDVKCLGKIIEIRSRGKRFSADSPAKAIWNSIDYWVSIIHKVEYRLGVSIFKPKCIAFEITYQEFETKNSVLALDAEERGHIWRVYHSEDGKLRLSVDWSEETPNHETHHYRDAYLDKITINRIINDFLDNPKLPLHSEICKLTFANNEQIKQNIESISLITKELQSITEFLKFRHSENQLMEIQTLKKPYYFG